MTFYVSVGKQVITPSESLCLFGVKLFLHLSGISPEINPFSTLLHVPNGYVRGRFRRG